MMFPRLGGLTLSRHCIFWSILPSPTCIVCISTCSGSLHNDSYSLYPMNQTSQKGPTAMSSSFLVPSLKGWESGVYDTWEDREGCLMKSALEGCCSSNDSLQYP